MGVSGYLIQSRAENSTVVPCSPHKCPQPSSRTQGCLLHSVTKDEIAIEGPERRLIPHLAGSSVQAHTFLRGSNGNPTQQTRRRCDHRNRLDWSGHKPKGSLRLSVTGRSQGQIFLPTPKPQEMPTLPKPSFHLWPPEL